MINPKNNVNSETGRPSRLPLVIGGIDKVRLPAPGKTAGSVQLA